MLFKLRSALVCTLSLLATASLAQTTIHVGSGQTYTTIQSGINAANNGDTVLVAPGTYLENINFNGKAITVTSSGGESSTIIDGGNKPGVATVLFANGETSTSVISGFTIRGGGDAVPVGYDGGVYVDQASPTIQANNITANYCHGINVEGGVATIFGNGISGVLQGSSQNGMYYGNCFLGGGILLGGTPNSLKGLGSTIVANLISDTLTGSGISMWAAQNVLIMGNTIRNNTSPYPGSAFNSANSVGTVIVQNLIYGNTSSCGGALAFQDAAPLVGNPQILIANNTLVDNVSTAIIATGGSECIPIAQIYPDPYSYGTGGPGEVIMNNIVTGSTPYPAVNCSWFETPSEAIQPTFQNNILNNAGGPFFGSYCVDVSDKYNNITSDPQFVDRSGDFHLKSTSPAIDTGNNSVLQIFKAMTGLDFSLDAGGNPRVQNGSGKGCIIDMGAYEYTGTLSGCGGSETSETLTSSLNPAMAGQNVTFAAQLSTASGNPTGSLQFLDGANPLSTQTVSSTGSAAFSTASLAIGSHTITANYQPTGSFGAATASLTQVINGYTTGTTLTCQPNPIDIGNTAQFTATVTSANGTPTGSIAFTDNGAALAAKGLINGTTSLTYTGSIAGKHTITAAYAPTGSYGASAPGPATCSEVVNTLPTTTVLTATPATSTYGTPVTLTATVSPATLPGPSTPTGVVTFYNGASAIGTGTLAGGVATLAGVSLPGGSYDLLCTYSGSSIYSTSGNSVRVNIHAAPSALTLSSSKNPASALSPVTFTVRLTVNGQSAGAGKGISFSINGQTVYLLTDATGSATHSVDNLTPNSYPVTASFATNGDLLTSSASLTEVIDPIPTTTSLAATPNPGNVGQQVMLKASIATQPLSPTTSVVDGSGSVTFYDGSASLGSAQVTSYGTASLAASFSTVGVHDITAMYSGSTDFSASSSAAFKETIMAGDFSIGVSPATATVYTGEATNANVSVTSLQGFNEPLALTCTGLPANTTCSFNPASLTAGQGAAKLVIQTAAPHKTGASAGSVSSSAAVLGALTSLLLPGWRRRRRLLAGLSVVLLAVGVGMGITGCGSPNPITGGTPPGVYQVAVTATTTGNGQALTHSAVVTLTVKSLF